MIRQFVIHLSSKDGEMLVRYVNCNNLFSAVCIAQCIYGDRYIIISINECP